MKLKGLGRGLDALLAGNTTMTFFPLYICGVFVQNARKDRRPFMKDIRPETLDLRQ